MLISFAIRRTVAKSVKDRIWNWSRNIPKQRNREKGRGESITVKCYAAISPISSLQIVPCYPALELLKATNHLLNSEHVRVVDVTAVSHLFHARHR